jgi:hypothetical protein
MKLAMLISVRIIQRTLVGLDMPDDHTMSNP